MAGLRIALVPAVIAVLLGGCGGSGSEPVSLLYEPTLSLPVGPADNVVAVGPVIDARGVPPAWVGKAAGKFGWHDEPLIAESSAAAAVRAAFTDALMSRGLLAPPGAAPFELRVRILQLEANQAWRRRAAADFALTLTRGRNGPVVYSEQVQTTGRGTGLFTPDTSAAVPVAEIGDMLQHAMSEAIDTALDKAEFRAALAR